MAINTLVDLINWLGNPQVGGGVVDAEALDSGQSLEVRLKGLEPDADEDLLVPTQRSRSWSLAISCIQCTRSTIVPVEARSGPRRDEKVSRLRTKTVLGSKSCLHLPLSYQRRR